MSAARPPLPGGPYLVVGLARSGASRVRCRSLRRRSRRRGRRGRRTRKLGTRRPRPSSSTPARSSRRPGVPAEAPVIAAARARGIPVLGELELAWRLLPNEFIAVTGHERQDDDDRAASGTSTARPGCRSPVAGNVGTALTPLVGALAPGRGRRLRGVVVPARGHRRVRARGRRAAQPRSPTTSTATAPSRPTARRSCASSRNQGNDDVAVAPVGLGVEDLGGCARRVCFGTGPPAPSWPSAPGELWWDDEPLIAVDELRLRGAHNRAERDGRGGGLPRPRDRRRRGPRRRCGRSPASSTASRRSRRRRRALRQRLQGDERRLDARRARRASPARRCT